MQFVPTKLHRHVTLHAVCVQVMEVDVDMLTCQVTEGLTEDAVSARLHQGTC